MYPLVQKLAVFLAREEFSTTYTTMWRKPTKKSFWLKISFVNDISRVSGSINPNRRYWILRILWMLREKLDSSRFWIEGLTKLILICFGFTKFFQISQLNIKFSQQNY